MFILNAFSANMLNEFPCTVTFEEIGLEAAKTFEVVSAIGHADTAAVFSQQLGHEVLSARTTVTLKKGDTALLGQYIGPRLPEGCKVLPDGAAIKWLVVKVG